jgi:sugar fermentation stimulation protein A
MNLPSPLLSGTLIHRYKRFLADIRLKNGHIITAHCPNSGSMTGCAMPGWPVLVSKSSNPNRKLKYTWELVYNGVCWIGINTLRTNHITREAIAAAQIPELGGYNEIISEVPYGVHTRLDFLLKKPGQLCYVEVKSVTLVMKDGNYAFPDAVTTRGARHLDALMRLVRSGHRAVLLFVVQRSDGKAFRPAHEIDPVYAKKLKTAADSGVEVMVYGTKIDETRISLSNKIPFVFSRPRGQEIKKLTLSKIQRG